MSPILVSVVFVTILVMICVWDAWLAFDNVKDNTISTILRNWFLSYVWLYYLASLFLGILIGHWSPV